MLPRGKQNAAPSTDPSAIFLALQRNDPGTNIKGKQYINKEIS
jgi:hypothetical protein